MIIKPNHKSLFGLKCRWKLPSDLWNLICVQKTNAQFECTWILCWGLYPPTRAGFEVVNQQSFHGFRFIFYVFGRMNIFHKFWSSKQHSFSDHIFISYSLRVVWWPVRRAHTKTRLAGIHFCSFFLNIFLFWIFMKHSLNIHYIYLIYLISPIPHVSQTVPGFWGEPRQSKIVAVICFFIFSKIFFV